MTATHAPGCPALDDVRDGCACLLRGVAAQGDAPHEMRRVAHYTQHGVSLEPDDGQFSWVRAVDAEAALRACEARVRKTAFNYERGLAEGRRYALRQAMEAVDNVPAPNHYAVAARDAALAAIDALKEEK